MRWSPEVSQPEGLTSLFCCPDYIEAVTRSRVSLEHLGLIVIAKRRNGGLRRSPQVEQTGHAPGRPSASASQRLRPATDGYAQIVISEEASLFYVSRFVDNCNRG